MCGRYASTRSAADLSALFEALDQTTEYAPRYNLAPTDPAPIVRVSRSQAARVLSVARWGLLPHWARDPREGARMINARVETVATARAYAESYASRRALVPADGWYEWRKDPTGGRQAYFMTGAGGEPLALAGLWSAWSAPGAQGGSGRVLTFSVLTAPAAGDLVDIHDRMPLVLPPPQWDRWLAEHPPELPDLVPGPELVAGLEIRPVGPAVGNVRNDGPDLVRRVQAPQTLF